MTKKVGFRIDHHHDMLGFQECFGDKKFSKKCSIGLTVAIEKLQLDWFDSNPLNDLPM